MHDNIQRPLHVRYRPRGKRRVDICDPCSSKCFKFERVIERVAESRDSSRKLIMLMTKTRLPGTSINLEVAKYVGVRTCNQVSSRVVHIYRSREDIICQVYIYRLLKQRMYADESLEETGSISLYARTYTLLFFFSFHILTPLLLFLVGFLAGTSMCSRQLNPRIPRRAT